MTAESQELTAKMNYQYGGKDLTLLQYLEERIRKNPASSFFAMLAYFYLEIDKVAEALSIAQRGVIAHPDYSTGHVVLAMAMMRAGLFSDARKELLRAADLHPGSKMVDVLTAELEKQEQADTIGRRLAEQFRKSSSGDKDIMKTVEQTLKTNPVKGSDEDSLIPGLDSIIGEDMSKLSVQLMKPSLPTELPDTTSNQRPGKQHPEKGGGSSIARAIIDKVAREFSEESRSLSGDERKSSDENGISQQEEIKEGETREDEFDIDMIARELESAGPIKPDKEQPHGHEEDPGIELTPEIVTDTLATIFEQQGQINTAIEAYKILLKKKPERAEFYRGKITELTLRADAPR